MENEKTVENEETVETEEQATDVIIEEFKKQIADLNLKIEQMKKDHKEEIINIIRGCNKEEEIDPEKKQINECIEKINMYRRKV